ncbi:MAG: hypothetical protein HZA46_17910, partial [Planctomycetales bacterium]|nr:hypothetical protein [Planctomycetales bacterium]
MFRSQAHWWFVALAVSIAVPFEAFPADPPPPRANQNPAANTTAPVRDEQQLAERKLLQEALPRIRKAETLLRTARQQFDRGEASAGLMTLQQLLNQPQDTFVWSATSARPLGVRSQAVALFESLPNSALQRYEELFGAEAGRLLAKARHDGNPQLLDEITRRFFLTAEGYDATVLLAAWWLDHGAPARSAAHWDQLFATPSHLKRIQPQQRMQAAIAYARCGRATDARRIAGNLAPELVATARRGASFEQWLQARATTTDATALAIGGLVAGAPHRNGIASGTAPVFRTPVWSAPLWRDANDELRPVLAAWEQELANDDGPGAISQFALCIGDVVVFRDVQGLRAVDVTTGKMLWHTPTLTSLSSLKFYHRTPTARGPNKFDLKFLDQLLGDNSAGGMLSSDGSRVYAVDQLDWKQATRQSNSLIAVDVGVNRGSWIVDRETKTTGGETTGPTKHHTQTTIHDPRHP